MLAIAADKAEVNKANKGYVALPSPVLAVWIGVVACKRGTEKGHWLLTVLDQN